MGNSFKEITDIPNNSDKPSLDKNVYIISWDKLSQEDQVENTAHEGYAHAYFYELSKNDQTINPNHKRENQLDSNGKCCIFTETNQKLKELKSQLNRQ